MTSEPDAQIKEIISRYLIDGDLDKFMLGVQLRYKELRSLRRWQE